MAKKKMKYKYDIVADQILNDITTGRWEVGKKLPSEASLIEEYQVSRVTLREGLKKLSVLGVLRIVQGDGTYVNEILPSQFVEPLYPLMAYNKENINEIYDARVCIESGACYLAALRRTEEQVKQLEEIMENMDDAIGFNDYASYSKFDREFHSLILKIAENKILETINNMFGDLISHYVTRINEDQLIIQKSMNDHWQLLWAIQDGNGEYAKVIMAEHLERSRHVLIDKVEAKK
jgi:GntR family transcriptional repressor for pyruvate dehydrogenase complex